MTDAEIRTAKCRSIIQFWFWAVYRDPLTLQASSVLDLPDQSSEAVALQTSRIRGQDWIYMGSSQDENVR